VFATPAATVSSPFLYTFNATGKLVETGSISLSSSPYFWLNSGAYMPIADGVGGTVQGTLPASDPWRLIYAGSNPADTDNGYRPQNIFRLVTRSAWSNVREEAYFKIHADNLSASKNRNASNGLLLMSRYQGGDTLYYAGIRVDGAAVIKKKKNGTYYTLGYEKLFAGTYDRTKNPNLLPKHIWIGLRSETVTNADGTVTVKLYTDVGKTGTWTLALSAVDDGKTYGGAALTKSGYAGIRTDFMDVSFDNFRLTRM
jgi:hypothetical protein